MCVLRSAGGCRAAASASEVPREDANLGLAERGSETAKHAPGSQSSVQAASAVAVSTAAISGSRPRKQGRSRERPLHPLVLKDGQCLQRSMQYGAHLKTSRRRNRRLDRHRLRAGQMLRPRTVLILWSSPMSRRSKTAAKDFEALGAKVDALQADLATVEGVDKLYAAHRRAAGRGAVRQCRARTGQGLPRSGLRRCAARRQHQHHRHDLPHPEGRPRHARRAARAAS